MNPTISLVMIVKNEERTLLRCLESASKYVDEIIIVDTGSKDQTTEIARDFGAKIYNFQWVDDFSEARNYALDQTSCDWCLVLDADEYILNDCYDTIRTFIAKGPAIGKVKRIDDFSSSDGINHEITYISRLFPANCRYVGMIHEQIVSELPRIQVNVEIQHDGYLLQTKSDRNIPILLKAIDQNPSDSYYHYQIAKEYRGMEDHERSFHYFKLAYQAINRREGYAASIIINYLYSIIASGHLEEGIAVIQNEQEFMFDYPDFYFVSALYLLELILSDPERYGHMISTIEQYYMKALEIGETEKEGSVVGTGSFAAHYNLGVYYEVTGNSVKANEQYKLAGAYKYQPALDRLNNLNYNR